MQSIYLISADMLQVSVKYRLAYEILALFIPHEIVLFQMSGGGSFLGKDPIPRLVTQTRRDIPGTELRYKHRRLPLKNQHSDTIDDAGDHEGHQHIVSCNNH